MRIPFYLLGPVASAILANMTVGVFGLGRFGTFWSKLLARRFAVVAYDIDPDRKAPEDVERVGLTEVCTAPTLFLCVAIRAMPEVLERIKPYVHPMTLVADTCSVKVFPAKWMMEILAPKTRILATHPMFGPESAKDSLDGLSIMLDPLRLDEGTMTFWEESFTSYGLMPIRMDCDRHDREAAYSQALTHLVGRSLHDIGLPETTIATRWYKKLHGVAKQCVRDARELFEDMQKFNPYAAGMRREVLRALAHTLADLGEDPIEMLREARMEVSGDRCTQ